MQSDDEFDPKHGGTRWMGWGRFVFLVVFVVVLYLLAASMVRHHFFSGGALNYRMSSGH